MSQPSPFKWRHFEAEIILLCVRWYVRYLYCFLTSGLFRTKGELAKTLRARSCGQVA
jgi:hypothetical protein